MTHDGFLRFFRERTFPEAMLLRGTSSLAKTDEKEPLSKGNHFQASRKALLFSAISGAFPLIPMEVMTTPP